VLNFVLGLSNDHLGSFLTFFDVTILKGLLIVYDLTSAYTSIFESADFIVNLVKNLIGLLTINISLILFILDKCDQLIQDEELPSPEV
jgi:hypothetical protein